MYSPFLFVPLLPHLDAGDDEEYIEDGAFDPNDMFQAGVAPGQPTCEDGVHFHWKLSRFSFRPTGRFCNNDFIM